MRPVSKGPAENFTGDVRIESLLQGIDQSPLSLASVTFAPGARTAWHSHPLGQVLVVTSGGGRVQSWGGPVEEIRSGDLVWCPPGEKHWHGAAPSTGMTHLSIVEPQAGKAGDWMEQVSDEQYLAGPASG